MIVKLLPEHHLEYSKIERRLHRLVRVYTLQNATLLEITCHGSFGDFTSMKFPENKTSAKILSLQYKRLIKPTFKTLHA